MEPSISILPSSIDPDDVAFVYDPFTAFELYQEIKTLASSETPELGFILTTLETFYGFNVTPT